jgi:hypothetical protein
MLAMVFLSFRWTEGEPAHVDLYSVVSRCQRQSRTEWAVGAVCLVGQDGDSLRKRSLECDLMVVLVDRDVNMDCGSVVRTGTWNLFATGETRKILKQRLTLPRQMITDQFLPLKAMAHSSVYTWSSRVICYRHVPG